MLRLLCLSLLIGACGSGGHPAIELATTDALKPAIDGFAAELPWTPVRVSASADPIAALSASGDGLQVAIIADLTTCTECFRIDPQGTGRYVIHADGVLGAQYGLAELLEATGFRFHHPLAPRAPAKLAPPPASSPVLGVLHQPETALRGLHLHTLHPIESLWAYWSGDDMQDLADARRINQWIVDNRGNYVQWVALDDIQTDPARAAAWRTRTKQIVDDAHARGLRVGLAIQLFGKSNLQHGFDLLDGDPTMIADPRAEIAARLTVLAGLGFDRVNVSFGEFFGVDPQLFIDDLNLATDELRKAIPGVAIGATIHVGGDPSQQVTYMGETLPYYFLVKYADPTIDPWVHTVMYYDLFEDAGGAYQQNDFHEHRQFLLDRLAAGKSVAYFPEAAYWVAFDDSVPQYLPLYVRSRWFDLAQLRAAAAAPLAEHVLFSSGWEWGYWQQDRATLRMTYELPATAADAVAALLPDAPALASSVVALMDAQHDALIGQRLAPYIAGRDTYIDLGGQAGIISQPDRPGFDVVAAYDATARAAFVAGVLDPLGAYATTVKGLADAVGAEVDATDPDQAEVADGFQIDAARAAYIHALYAAAVAKGEGGDPAASLAAADAALADAHAVVARRHALVPARDTAFAGNATIYPFGYLGQADTLCYWERERVQIHNVTDGKDDTIPACIF